MTLLIVGMVLFFGIHFVPTLPALRSSLAVFLGENGYKAAFSVISLTGFGLLLWGKAHAPYVALFSPPAWGRHVAMGLMVFSCISLVGTYLPTNLKRYTAHPMMWGTALWAIAHLFANGDTASVLLFGGFLAYALFDIPSANSRGAHPRGEPLPLWRDLVLLLVALCVYGLLLFVHPFAFGVSVLRH